METVSLKEIIFSSFEKMLCWKCTCKLHILKNRTGIVCGERFSLQFSIEMRCCCIVRKIDIAEFFYPAEISSSVKRDKILSLGAMGG
jgi:hypothetical protein